jgi:hypothetical protein
MRNIRSMPILRRWPLFQLVPRARSKSRNGREVEIWHAALISFGSLNVGSVKPPINSRVAIKRGCSMKMEFYEQWRGVASRISQRDEMAGGRVSRVQSECEHE